MQTSRAEVHSLNSIRHLLLPTHIHVNHGLQCQHNVHITVTHCIPLVRTHCCRKYHPADFWPPSSHGQPSVRYLQQCPEISVTADSGGVGLCARAQGVPVWVHTVVNM